MLLVLLDRAAASLAAARGPPGFQASGV